MLAPEGEFVGVEWQLGLQLLDRLGVFVEEDLCPHISAPILPNLRLGYAVLTVPYAFWNISILCLVCSHLSSGTIPFKIFVTKSQNLSCSPFTSTTSLVDCELKDEGTSLIVCVTISLIRSSEMVEDFLRP